MRSLQKMCLYFLDSVLTGSPSLSGCKALSGNCALMLLRFLVRELQVTVLSLLRMTVFCEDNEWRNCWRSI